MTFKVAVIGQGYVGLPLSIATAKNGFKTIGIDIDRTKVQKLNSGKSVVEDVGDDEIYSLIEKNLYRASTDFSDIIGVEIVVICVPTPLTQANEPDMSFLDSAAKSVAKFIKKDVLVILESTVSPGSTRNFLVPLLEIESGMSRNDFFVAFSPERIDPRNTKWNVKNTPKIVSGLNTSATNKATKFYSKFVDSIVECDSIEIAETAKLLENSFRLINISFINEISILCQKLDIDVKKVIEAASTKPYGFMPFYPSIGVGGHCIPIDPLYLANKAREVGAQTRFIDLADQINQEMPGYFVGRAEEKLGGLNAKKVLVVGVAYKPNVSDVRESPVKALITGLKQKGAQVFWHDDLVKEWKGEISVEMSNEYDLAILATLHDYLDLTKLGDAPILNTRGSI
jgi:UDP-N-acetyl-D-glucosamine dehydrogenase